jgi:hypothetical protein
VKKSGPGGSGGKDLRRFFRQGPREVLRAGLGVQGHDQVADVHNFIQPVHEVRAIRPHEYFSEGLPRFSFAATQVAVVGEFGGIAIGCFTGTNPAIRIPGTILVIDRLVVSTGAVVLRLADEAAIQATLGTGAIAFMADTRWGEAGTVAIAAQILSGSDVAQIGSIVGQSAAGLQSCVPTIITRPPEGKAATMLVAWGIAVNTAIAVEYGGYYLFPK